MTHAGEKVATFLRNAATKLEELQVQGALGRAELAEKLEHIKRDTRQGISQMKADVNAAVDTSKDKLQQVKAKLEHLEVQLALGKAETAEEFNKQKKKISDAFRDIKHLFEKDK